MTTTSCPATAAALADAGVELRDLYGYLIDGMQGTAGAIRGSSQDRANQQRYRDSGGRYYYCYDNRQSECYWDNGQRRY